MTNRRKKPEPVLELADGRTGVRRYQTNVWYDLRLKAPSPWTRGYPAQEVGSIETAARHVMAGRAAKVQCFDRVRGRVEWTVQKGERVPGTHVYQPIVTKGDV